LKKTVLKDNVHHLAIDTTSERDGLTWVTGGCLGNSVGVKHALHLTTSAPVGSTRATVTSSPLCRRAPSALTAVGLELQAVTGRNFQFRRLRDRDPVAVAITERTLSPA